jgi:hypothetical protein
LNGGPTTNTFAQTDGGFSLSSAPGEWDGDGIADHWLIRMGTDGSYIWSIFESRTGTARIVTWGSVFAGDSFAPADYDGDGVLDIAVFRRFTGVWYILQSSTGTIRIEAFGAVNDYPSIGDYDGDGRADLTIVRPGTQLAWWTRRSSDGQITVTPWGSPEGYVFSFAPIDVDGDGRQDIMINLPLFASGQRLFVIRQSSNGGAYHLTWGLIDDFVHFGDYDGDGRTDFVSRRNVGGQLLWFIHQSANGQARYVLSGITGDQ